MESWMISFLIRNTALILLTDFNISKVVHMVSSMATDSSNSDPRSSLWESIH